MTGIIVLLSLTKKFNHQPVIIHNNKSSQMIKILSKVIVIIILKMMQIIIILKIMLMIILKIKIL